MERTLTKLKITGKTQIQRLFITVQLFGENGLANHAAAGAFGFLLSVAPMLLLIAFFILVTFQSSPQAIAALISNIPFLDIIFDDQWLTGDFLFVSRPGISGVISVLSIFWAGRILALSMQRGLKIIFPGTKSRNPVTDTLVTLAVEAVVLLFILILIFTSQTALHFYKTLHIFSETSILYSGSSEIWSRIFPFAALGAVSFFAYLFVPVTPPGKLSALRGALFCTFTYGCTAMALGIMLNRSRYNFLYGTLGNLIILLVNVYFFFTFFFLGAQLAFVLDSFDALLFSKLRQTRTRMAESGRLPDAAGKIFFSVEGKLKKYLNIYKEGETIFSLGDMVDDIYYILEGEVEIFISSTQNADTLADILKPGFFFGEMGHLLSEDRCATARAKTSVSALALPPAVFDEILKYDTSLDRTLIEHLSRRLKKTNEQIAILTSER